MAKAKPPLTLEQLQDKLVLWQQRMNLLHWEITINPDDVATTGDDDEVANAEMVAHTQYDRAELRLGAGWRDWDPRDIGDLHISIDYLLAHELVHCWMRDLDRMAFDDLSGKIHRDAAEMYGEIYHRGREHLVDHIARALVDGWGPA